MWNVLRVENFAVRIWFKFKKDIRVIVKSSALDDASGRSAVEKSPDLNIWIEFPIPGILFVPGHEPQNKNAVLECRRLVRMQTASKPSHVHNPPEA